MSATVEIDPYSLVAKHLQEGEATRAELKTLTGLEYHQIEAALHRFAEVTECIEGRTDSSDIEHYSWREDAAPYDPDHNAAEPDPYEGQITATSLGIHISDEVRAIIRELPEGAEIDAPHIYNSLLVKFPSIKTITNLNGFRANISQILRSLDDPEGIWIHLVEIGKAGRPHLYKRNGPNTIEKPVIGRPPIEVDLKLLEDLLANADLTIAEVGEKLGIHRNLIYYRKEADPEFSAAYERGLARREQSRTNRNGNKQSATIGGEIDPARVEELAAADCSTTEMCAALGISESTWKRHRKNNPELEAAYWRGIEKRNAVDKTEDEPEVRKEEPARIAVQATAQPKPNWKKLMAPTIPPCVTKAIRGAKVELEFQSLWGEESPMCDLVKEYLHECEAWLSENNAYYVDD